MKRKVCDGVTVQISQLSQSLCI